MASVKIVLLINALMFPALVFQIDAWRCSSCEVPYKAKGCYRDNPSNRVLKVQVLNERDPRSKVYGGRRIDWMDWNNYMPGFACRCAQIVKAKGWKVFGLQFYGECWSGPGPYDLENFKESEACITDDYKGCGRFDRNCIGKQWTNFVYELASDCDLDFERIGCFTDNKIDPRPLPDYIMTDRERRLKIYSGQSIDWRNWDAYLPEFVCRCAEKAKEKGHTTFGVQYYGECWSGPHGEYTYAKIGMSHNCVDKCFETCRPYPKFCAGKDFANAVYRLSDAPCEISFEPVGCYDEVTNNRALPVELENQVNPASPKFRGVMMEYGNRWHGEFRNLLCRCARKASLEGYSMFGVHNLGECWTATHANQTYNKHGQSANCFQNYNQTCLQGSDACAGGADTNYVYKILPKRSLADEHKVPVVASSELRYPDFFDDTATEVNMLRRLREKEIKRNNV